MFENLLGWIGGASSLTAVATAVAALVTALRVKTITVKMKSGVTIEFDSKAITPEQLQRIVDALPKSDFSKPKGESNGETAN